jgi:hypothetical protein
MASTIPWSSGERNATFLGNRAARAGNALLGLSLWCLAGCSGDPVCNIDATTRRVGGAGVMDCRISSDEESVARVDQCSVEAYQARATFRAIYRQEDGTLEAIIHAAGDTYHLLRTEVDGPGIEEADCEGAHVVRDQGRTYVHCDDPGEFTRICP